MVKKPKLSLVQPASTASIRPSRKLGPHGRALWNAITSEYAIEDVAGIEMMTQACQALDRAEALAEQIEEDGPVLRTRGTVRAHPAIPSELQNRAFVVRTLAKLGLNYEAIKAQGRPTSAEGWGLSYED
jgi:hypothetical protein